MSGLAHGFDALRLPLIRAAVDAPNTESLKLLSKLGFQPLSEIRDTTIPLLTFLAAPEQFREAVAFLDA